MRSSALSDAIENDTVFSLQRMSSGSLAHTSKNVSLFYGESWSVVSFLIDKYGEDKFAELFATFKQGSTVDKAFQQVYGFDQDGLENAWRESVGLAAKQSTGQQEQSTPLPQLTPFDGQRRFRGAAGEGRRRIPRRGGRGPGSAGSAVVGAAAIAVARRRS